MAKRVDIQVEGGMGFYQFVGLTGRGLRWLKANLCAEPWQWTGGGIACAVEGREYAMDIAAGAKAEGLTVR